MVAVIIFDKKIIKVNGYKANHDNGDVHSASYIVVTHMEVEWRDGWMTWNFQVILTNLDFENCGC